MNESQLNEQQGLTSQDVKQLLKKYGKNELAVEKKESVISKVLHVFSEPMFLLLFIASIIYFILGEPRDGAIMLIFVTGIISIEAIQEWKTDKTLQALKNLSAPQIKVLRDGEIQVINSSDLVPGDIMYIAEGVKVPADGFVIRSSTLRVDESSLTGESESVWKITREATSSASRDYWKKDYCYAGTLVTQGTGTILVDKTGLLTEYGKIGMDVASAPDRPTPLEKQTDKLVKLCAGIAAFLLVLVGIVTFFNLTDHDIKSRIIESILSGITLAMAMIPEEFPVILTVFLSMGAWRLAKKNSLIRKLPAVETLGAVSVLCVDKTGTITMNKMTVQETWHLRVDAKPLDLIMVMACKADAYDPMEKAIIAHCETNGISKSELFSGELIKEYGFTDETKMMGNVYKKGSGILVAAKGSPENLLHLCDMTEEDKAAVDQEILEMSNKGLRVIAVGQMTIHSEIQVPSKLTDCCLTLCGLIGLADPPRESIKSDIECCTRAGVRVVMITGDNGITASSIAKQINMPNSENIITGDELHQMSDQELREKVRNVSIFSRVLPEHKMRIVKAFKENGEIVAMTGDGVNDAPALKYADIGIAMGKRGSEVSREAADLILLDDNFSTIVDTIEDGRRIYDNIRKAVGYVFAIHIPIAGASLVAPLMGISPVSLFLLPIHVVLLELVIDPTCSIVLERQPAEPDIMDRAPRDPNEKLVTMKLLSKNVIQGLAIFGAAFGAYLWSLNQHPSLPAEARTMGLSIILMSNIFLVFVNSSNKELAIKSLAKLSRDKVMLAVTAGTFIGLLVMIYSPINVFLKLSPLPLSDFLWTLGIAFASVAWYELVKLKNIKIHV
ncbi:MAG: HAD-IC family P-type ATPase [Acidaminobacter sp.]|uniref:cation-translocating P-type ATPase n=1 Tax=Acidaminobacter sp. TaxID=1872102 RepID=UPI00137F1A41|nr:cation-translocating P-type ATPase [Acidaminobacter sp.]MZQ99633.1 HAD-IC family P-type ATPase [Acidaminobacter sp.]